MAPRIGHKLTAEQLLARALPRSPLIDRFESYVSPEPMSGCWLWTGATQKGYGALVTGSRVHGTRRMQRAHQLSWQLHRGPIPEGLDVCHSCDVPSCVNPDHLFLGTRKVNIQDARDKDRLRPWNKFKAECVNGHPLSGDNLAFDRDKRRCRECSRLRTAARRIRLLGEAQ